MDVDLRLLDQDNDLPQYSYNIGLTVGDVSIQVPDDLDIRVNGKIGSGNFRVGTNKTNRVTFMPVYEDGLVFCVDRRYPGRYMHEDGRTIIDEDVVCDEETVYSWIEYRSLGSGLNVESNYATSSEYDLEFKVDVGIGRITVMRYPEDES